MIRIKYINVFTKKTIICKNQLIHTPVPVQNTYYNLQIKIIGHKCLKKYGLQFYTMSMHECWDDLRSIQLIETAPVIRVHRKLQQHEQNLKIMNGRNSDDKWRLETSNRFWPNTLDQGCGSGGIWVLVDYCLTKKKIGSRHNIRIWVQNTANFFIYQTYTLIR